MRLQGFPSGQKHSRPPAGRNRVANSALDEFAQTSTDGAPPTPTGRTLLGARTVLGISTLLAPRLAGKGFLLDPDTNPQLPVIGRMWGIRNLSLATGMYAATGANRAHRWRLQPAVDALDLLAIATEWRRRSLPGLATGLMGATALAATTLGAPLIAGESEQRG